MGQWKPSMASRVHYKCFVVIFLDHLHDGNKSVKNMPMCFYNSVHLLPQIVFDFPLMIIIVTCINMAENISFFSIYSDPCCLEHLPAYSLMTLKGHIFGFIGASMSNWTLKYNYSSNYTRL